MYTNLGLTALLTLLSHVLFIGVSFHLLKALRFEQLLRPNHVAQSRMLMLFLAIALGYLVSEFFLSFLTASGNLRYLL
ncbi:DUF1146 family protein [Lacticaseibacillus daqingensis]|uniref:DUF1146 family protein n=1 Tax=Lacticaseibacillus daqingensis TaxID=2486014 RepID=UPI000F78E340|nr:DUF1146 family protein [Lacticaseibacillus daqingensis]